MLEEEQFTIEVTVKVNGYANQLIRKSRIEGIEFILKHSDNVDPEPLQSDGCYTEHGCQIITDTLVEGLISNIHYAHQNGKIDSAKHLRKIIEKLEKGLIEQVSFQRKPNGKI